eukprot:CAMPEP_0195061356 /NCGR_PEP_ID=MMETSP0448-20130528/8319_1 /TAXON_ID=66468 /ORGANISM="Heterocapsa triquestra, Strain CCMP 448" /LENGTH=454 /DNA_ID=CAMNT_0040091909 /DNA_START=74 /DNA_END=1438 /DNA_ORIENTATION=+
MARAMHKMEGTPTLLGLLCFLAHLHVTQSAFVRQHKYVGEDFFSRWWFWHWPDLTHGHVDYINETVAKKAGLINATEDRAFIGSDMWNKTGGGPRRSVKIYSNDVYQSGLFIITLDHMPTGCGTWPAFWMVGGNSPKKWPVWGEIDIIESVHETTRVSTTLHTDEGCDQSGVVAGKDFTGEWETGASNNPASNCDVKAQGQWANQGCGQKGPEGTTGAPFNAKGGGTFAMHWDPDKGISTWFFPNGTEPADLTGDSIWGSSPKPWKWGRPYSHFDLQPKDGSCPKSHFRNMRLVFDLTFCGDMGSMTFASQCGAQASSMTCEQLVSDHPEAFADAYWSVRRLDVYQWRERKDVLSDLSDVMHRVMSTAALPQGGLLRAKPAEPRHLAFMLLLSVPLALPLLGVAYSCWKRPPWACHRLLHGGVVPRASYALMSDLVLMESGDDQDQSAAATAAA